MSELWMASHKDEIVAQAPSLEELCQKILDVGAMWANDDQVTIMKVDGNLGKSDAE